jgi:hypothetical protein
VPANVDSAGKKIVFDQRCCDVRKIVGAGGRDYNVISSAQHGSQRVFGGHTTKDVSRADKQDSAHVVTQ